MKPVLSLLLCGLLQLAAGNITAGQRGPAHLPEGASLAETVEWLAARLVRYGKMRYYDPSGPFEHKYYDTRFEYLRAEGCVVKYRDSAMSRGYEYSADLAAIDPTQVTAEVPKGWVGGRVNFSSAAGESAVTYRTRGGRTYRYRTGAFAVSDERELEGIAEALRRAVSMCRSYSKANRN